MKSFTSELDVQCDRRSFLKTVVVTLAGVLVACTPKMPGVRSSTSTQLPTIPDQSTAKPPVLEPTAASSSPTAGPVSSPTTAPTATSTKTSIAVPTACPPDVVCDQAALTMNSQSLDRTYSMRARNPGPAHIITSLCLRDGSCIMVCPVECIVRGKPQNLWPRTYIDPDTCIDCGACIPECPHAAIFPEDEVPVQYIARGGEYINRPGICGHYEGIDHDGESIVLDTVCRLAEGQVVDLIVDIQDNYDFFYSGPGYEALYG